jgi:hypothetical protein
MRVSPEQQAAPETLRLEFSRFFQIIDTDRDEIITEQEYIAGLDLAKEVLKRTDEGEQGHKHVERVRAALDAAKDLAVDGTQAPTLNVDRVLAAAQTLEQDALAQSLGFVLDVLCTTDVATNPDGADGTKSHWLTLLPVMVLWLIVYFTSMGPVLHPLGARPGCSTLLDGFPRGWPEGFWSANVWMKSVDNHQMEYFDDIVALCYPVVYCESCNDTSALGSVDDTFAYNETLLREPGCTEDVGLLGLRRDCGRHERGGVAGTAVIFLNLDAALAWVAILWSAHVVWLIAWLCTKAGRDVFRGVALVQHEWLAFR